MGGISESAKTYLPDGRISIWNSIGPPTIYTPEQLHEYEEKLIQMDLRFEERLRTCPRTKERIRTIIGRVLNRGIEEAIRDDPRFKSVSIVQSAYDKASAASKKIVNLYGQQELFIHLMASREKASMGDATITDVFIPWEQYVTGVRCYDSTPQGREKNKKELEGTDLARIGWGHSHGELGTFFSSTDLTAIRTLYGASGIVKDKLTFENPLGGPDKEYEITIHPSIVFNARDSVTAGVSVLHPTYIGTKKTLKSSFFNNARVNIIKDEGERPLVDDASLTDEIKRKVFPSRDTRRDVSKTGEVKYLPTGRDSWPIERGVYYGKLTEVPVEKDAVNDRLTDVPAEKEKETVMPLGSIDDIVSKRIQLIVEEQMRNVLRDYEILANQYEDLFRRHSQLQTQVSDLEKILGER